MNPYTSMWTGVTPGDGPQEFHLVLLDNGRTRALADEVGRAALHCIRCSACLNVCPVYERTGGHAYGSVYPGPIGAVLTPQLTGMTGGERPERLAAVRLLAVRRLLRRLPGEDRHPRPARRSCAPSTPRPTPTPTASPRPRRPPWPPPPGSWATPPASRTAGRAASAGRHGIRKGRPLLPLPPPLSGWTASRDLPCPAARDVPRLVGPDPGEQLVSARDEVLARIRGALGEQHRRSPTYPAPTARQGEHAAGSSELTDQLVDRLEDYRASVVRAADDDDAIGAAIAAALADKGIREVIAPSGLPSGWLPSGLSAHIDDGSLGARDLDAIPAVVTGSAVAISETGTIVLDGTDLTGRRAITLVPDTHVVVVRAADVVQTVPEALRRLDPTRPLTFISGPSATSDIELDRVEGVHGPRNLVVVLAG